MNISELPIIDLRPFHPREKAQMEIDEEFEHFGLHPQCQGCAEPCRQYAAPGSRIIYCKRIAA